MKNFLLTGVPGGGKTELHCPANVVAVPCLLDGTVPESPVFWYAASRVDPTPWHLTHLVKSLKMREINIRIEASGRPTGLQTWRPMSIAAAVVPHSSTPPSFLLAKGMQKECR